MKAVILLLLGILNNTDAIQLSDTVRVEDFEEELLVDLGLSNEMDIPSDPVAGRPVVNYLDPERQKHTDKVIDHISKRTFNDYHDSLKEYHDTVKSIESGNYKHPEPLSKTDQDKKDGKNKKKDDEKAKFNVETAKEKAEKSDK